MSVNSNFIVDNQLPLEQNFSALKEYGLNVIKKMAGHVWTNYNECDPGVTILDQVCYALTELGYCTGFSIEDVLTEKNGEIKYENQFFKPQDILTSSPVTLEDYRKLVIDQFPEVLNIYIDIELNNNRATGCYKSYIYLDNSHESTNDENSKQYFPSVVHEFLNSNRNITEVFSRPVVLEREKIEIAGKIYLDKSASVKQVYKDISSAFLNYVSARVLQAGYEQLKEKGLQTENIFNGPYLKNGWIDFSDNSGKKRTVVKVIDLTAILAGIDGIVGLESIQMTLAGSSADAGVEKIKIAEDKVAEIVLSDQFYVIQSSGTNKGQSAQSEDQYLNILKEGQKKTSVQAVTELCPKLPNGQFRNIEEYYSIQNTFPDIYAVGPNSIHSEASSYRVAQSRQLKAYLLLFDQLLANQFSQLANVGNIFSFYPEDKIELRWPFKKPHIYFKKFSKTYYFQPLYDIPDVKSLLKGHDAYKYRYGSTEKKLVELDAWKRFCKDPYNQYMFNLRQIMESYQDSDLRRNEILSHIMARHGQVAVIYEDMVKESHWYGDSTQNEIVINSILLQNFKELSYFRSAAAKFKQTAYLPGDKRFYISPSVLKLFLEKLNRHKRLFDSGEIAPDALKIDEAVLTELIQITQKSEINQKELVLLSKHIQVIDNYSVLNDVWYKGVYPKIDGQLNQDEIYRKNKITQNELERFSTFELKSHIYLGMDKVLLNLASVLLQFVKDGSIFETRNKNDQKNDQGFDRNKKKIFHLPETDYCIVRSGDSDKLCYQNNLTNPLMEIVSCSGTEHAAPNKKDYLGHIDQMYWLAEQRKGMLLIEHIFLLDNYDAIKQAEDDYYLQASIVIPNYINKFNNPEFIGFVSTLIRYNWPAHVKVKIEFAGYKSLTKLLPAYRYWCNGLTKGCGLNYYKSSKTDRQDYKYWINSAQKIASMLGLSLRPFTAGDKHAG